MIRTTATDLVPGTDLDRSVTVNASPIQLRDVDFAATTRAAVENAGLGPSRMILEITESALVEPDPTVDHNLETPRLAEGVETPEQLAILQSLGCHALQGFLLARPAPDIFASHRTDLVSMAG